MKVLYFTATGNNLYVAKRIGGEYYSIPKLIKEGRFELEDEKIGIVFPAYYLDVPTIVEEFLNKVKLKSNYVFAVISYGAFSGTITSQLLKIGKRNGIEFSYINEILMVDNYLPMFDMDKEMQKEPKKNIEESLEQIIKDIEAEKKYIRKNTTVSKCLASMVKNIISPIGSFIIFENKDQFEKNFYVEDCCNGCRVCEKVCPVDNVKVDKKPVFKENCQRCLACINHCPQNAIRIKGERSKARFINEKVTLKEIIDANN